MFKIGDRVRILPSAIKTGMSEGNIGVEANVSGLIPVPSIASESMSEKEIAYEITFDNGRHLFIRGEYIELVTVYERHPLGIMPRSIWVDMRRNELLEAIKRYLDAGIPILQEWVDEWNAGVK